MIVRSDLKERVLKNIWDIIKENDGQRADIKLLKERLSLPDDDELLDMIEFLEIDDFIVVQRFAGGNMGMSLNTKGLKNYI